MSPHRLDGRPERAQDRRLLTVIALAIIALSCVLGIAYLGIWQRASEDLSRLLPASTRAYVQLPSPWKGMNQTLRHGIWRNRGSVREALRDDGYLAKPTPGDLAGLPLETVRDILRSASGLELALVPSSGSDTMMAFVEIDESQQRRRILSRLKPLVTSVDRHAGFRIESFKELEWHRYLGYASLRPLLVDMDPWLVFAWGNPQGLEDLLDARVGGRYDALYRRPGFVASGLSPQTEPLRLVIDATSAWRIATSDERPQPGGFIERLDLLTLESDASNSTRLKAELSDADFGATLNRALARDSSHPTLSALAPANAIGVITVRSPSMKRLLSLFSLLDFGLRRDFAPGAPGGGLAMALRTDPDTIPDTAVEVALVFLPDSSSSRNLASPVPLVLIRPTSPEALGRTLTTAWPSLFGDGFAFGTVHVGSAPISVLRPQVEVAVTLDGSPPEASAELSYVPPNPADGIAWRVRNGLLEMATDAETLLRFERADQRLGESTTFLAQTRDLAPSPIQLLIRSEALALLGPLGALVESRVASGTWLAATLDAVDSHLEVRSSIGLWTLLVTLASASRRDFDDLTLDGLEPRCASAYLAFCEVYPNAIPCRPFDLGHRGRIDELCTHLEPR